MNASFFPTPPADRRKRLPRHGRTALIGLAVAALHAGLVWTLQSGLRVQPAPLIVPVELLAQVIEPPRPQPAPAPPAPPVKPLAAVPKKAAPRPPVPAPAQPLAIPDPAPAAIAPAGSLAPAAPPESAPAPATPLAVPAPPPVPLPSSSADYLQNPKPAYPPLSKRLGEQGKVVVRVLIGADGQAQKAELRQSSGFERLDQAALATVLKWRYLPGKRGGVAEDMWFNVPINFVLE
ncbi:MAG: energy transducer TonB [Microbacteriaceae bacterium]|nr:energy transducer TonB [Burkholderiaceae bacterium]